VKLSPKDTCVQGLNTNGVGGAVVCYHIMAAKLSIGTFERQKEKPLPNVTQLKGKFNKGLKDGRKYRKNEEEKLDKKDKAESKIAEK
jgi:hypothetical protein